MNPLQGAPTRMVRYTRLRIPWVRDAVPMRWWGFVIQKWTKREEGTELDRFGTRNARGMQGDAEDTLSKP